MPALRIVTASFFEAREKDIVESLTRRRRVTPKLFVLFAFYILVIVFLRLSKSPYRFCVRFIWHRRGKSEHRSAIQWLTATGRKVRKSATERMYG